MLSKVKLLRNRNLLLSNCLFSTSAKPKLAVEIAQPQTLQFVIDSEHLKQLGSRKFDDQLFP